MRIAILGIRGIPATYGGFETCAEELATRLAQRGHEVTVYCRSGHYSDRISSYEGVRLVYRPALKAKAAETLSHTLFSIFSGVRHADAILIFNVANSPCAWIAELLGKPCALNLDGMEWKRRKWGALGRTYFRFAAFLAARYCKWLIADSHSIMEYYGKRYGACPEFIAYGARVEASQDPGVLEKFGLKTGGYILSVSRLEPENNADLTLRAFEGLQSDINLVIVGGASYKSGYARELFRTRDRRVKFLGPIYDKKTLREIWCNSALYVHGNEVGGTNPALLQALGYGNCVLALNVPFNAEVVGDAAILYEKDEYDLRKKMELLLGNPELVKSLRKRAVEQITLTYDWEKVTDAYERLFRKMLGKKN